MKKHKTRGILLMLVLDLVLVFVLSTYIANTGKVPAADDADIYTDGTYTASAQGCLSEVGVTVTIVGGRVTNVAIDASGETPALGGQAAETLAPALAAAGSTAGVDAVSGSTMTSEAVFAAMESCLEQAGQ